MMMADPLADYRGPAQRPEFNPYSENGGTVAAVAGDDYALIACDLRLISGFQIFSREQSKLFKLSDKTILGSSGCWCDSLTLTKLLEIRMQMYQYDHNNTMSTPAVSQLLSTMMYNRRFFPYYVSNVLAGLDNEGKGVVYHYDPIGHTAASTYKAGGSSGAIIQPILDNQLGLKNQQNVIGGPIPMERAITVVKDAFISAAEREIGTGDGIHMCIITKEGVKEEFFPLRKD